MKKDIHPPYFPAATVKCGCGAIYQAGSTKESLQVEICSACHPFFSGEEKVIDAAGRVERFKRRRAAVIPPAPKVKKLRKVSKINTTPIESV